MVSMHAMRMEGWVKVIYSKFMTEIVSFYVWKMSSL